MGDFACSICQRLTQNSFVPSQQWQARSAISISENGKSYRAVASLPNHSAVFQIDGNIITTGQKCDKLLLVTEATASPQKGIATFIELKGKDINHAIDQLEGTVQNNLFTPHPKGKDSARARIVTAGCGPKSSSRSKLEEARIRFKSRYNIELRVLKNGQPDSPLNL